MPSQVYRLLSISTLPEVDGNLKVGVLPKVGVLTEVDVLSKVEVQTRVASARAPKSARARCRQFVLEYCDDRQSIADRFPPLLFDCIFQKTSASIWVLNG